jgi:hemerythrin-like domain-containing protein
MASITQPLRDEHTELRPQIEAIRAAGDAVGEPTPADVAERVGRAHAFLSGLLLPHADAAEKALYPAVNQAMGSPEASYTMSLDHAEIRRLTGVLGELREKLAAGEITHQDQRELRMVLYGLYVLVRLHLEKEEEAFLPVLDLRLTPEEASEMFHRMEAAAAEAKRQAGSA